MRELNLLQLPRPQQVCIDAKSPSLQLSNYN